MDIRDALLGDWVEVGLGRHGKDAIVFGQEGDFKLFKFFSNLLFFTDDGSKPNPRFCLKPRSKVVNRYSAA